jgi:hypothetical protein
MAFACYMGHLTIKLLKMDHCKRETASEYRKAYWGRDKSLAPPT